MQDIKNMTRNIQAYNNRQTTSDKEICNLIAKTICSNLPQAENKIWHAHPVWFLDGNPIVGYSKLKNNIRLLFWSGQSFEDKTLQSEGSFKAAEMRYSVIAQVDTKHLVRLLKQAEEIQWDYKNLIKRKGKLEPLKGIVTAASTRRQSPYGVKKFKTIDEYHASHSVDIQIILTKLRKTITDAAPDAVEIISYNMPAFRLNKILVYYAVHKEHIGFYPTPFPITFFKDALSNYTTSKGAIQLSLKKPLPTALIKKIVMFRVKEDMQKSKKQNV